MFDQTEAVLDVADLWVVNLYWFYTVKDVNKNKH